MARALWQGQVIAEVRDVGERGGQRLLPGGGREPRVPHAERDDHCLRLEGHGPTTTRSKVDGARNADAAWYYPDPKPAAENIRNHVAFWRGVTVKT